MKIAVIGSGKLGKRHLDTWMKLEGVEIVGIVTRDPEKQRELAGKYDTKPYESIAEVLINVDVDVFDICTPTYTHLEFLILPRLKPMGFYDTITILNSALSS